jgi:hypothetical protein
VIERKYQMTRVRAGVYLLPSNDLQTLWRISSYTEHGDGEWANGRVIRGTFWETARHTTPLPKIAPHLIGDDEALDFLWGDQWESYSFVHPTRAEAIESALSATTNERTP